MPALLLPEIFASRIRAKAVSLSLGTHWVSDFTVEPNILPDGTIGVFELDAHVSEWYPWRVLRLCDRGFWISNLRFGDDGLEEEDARVLGCEEEP